jgi:AcrR family transcriptional regulator
MTKSRSGQRKISTTPTKAPRSITRRELYDLVWTKPLSSVAADFGISRNGIAKICDRLLIPYAGRGYWAQRTRNPKPQRPTLPAAPSDVETKITIAPGRSRSRRRSPPLSRELRRQQLIEIAGQIIAKEGLHACSMKHVAREAGISEAQAHNYFSRRTDLLVALAKREIAAMEMARTSALERAHDRLTRVTLSTIAYLRQVSERGVLIQILLNSPDVRAGLRSERTARATSESQRLAEQMETRYGVRRDVAHGTTRILVAVSRRAGRLLAEGKIPLDMAEWLSVAIIAAGNRSVAGRSQAQL